MKMNESTNLPSIVLEKSVLPRCSKSYQRARAFHATTSKVRNSFSWNDLGSDGYRQVDDNPRWHRDYYRDWVLTHPSVSKQASKSDFDAMGIGLTALYCYFLVEGHPILKQDGLWAKASLQLY